MTDKDVSEQKLSDNNQAEKQEVKSTLSNNDTKPNSSSTGDKKSAGKVDISVKKATSAASVKSHNKNKETKPSNKTATVALIVASISIAASIGHYFWQQQQNIAQVTSISQQNQQALQNNQTLLKKALTTEFNRQLQQQSRVSNQSQQSAKQSHLNSNAQIERLTTQVKQLEQQVSLRQPSDWLIHEAEYLVRVAARTMWLERDTKAAISLLRDADNRLKELDQPKFLPVRALINEDIEILALMPSLNNQEAVLTLMALNKQVPALELAGVNLAEALDKTTEDFVLSDDINDWQENLAKTWQKFLNDFITVRRRSGMVEPLMAPDQQQHLKQNLSLKIQLVQWAASEQKEEVYQQTLLDIQQWLNEFFDMNLAINKRFYQAIEQLKQQTIYYDYPSDLRSAVAIKRLLDSTKQGIKPQVKKVEVQNQGEPGKTTTDKPVAKNTEHSPALENTKLDGNKPASGEQL